MQIKFLLRSIQQGSRAADILSRVFNFLWSYLACGLVVDFLRQIALFEWTFLIVAGSLELVPFIEQTPKQRPQIEESGFIDLSTLRLCVSIFVFRYPLPRETNERFVAVNRINEHAGIKFVFASVCIFH